PRLSEKVSYRIELPPASELPSIYQWVRDRSQLPLAELAKTFNLGIGMVGVVTPRRLKEVLRQLNRSGERAWKIGEVVSRRRAHGSEVQLVSGSESVTLDASG